MTLCIYTGLCLTPQRPALKCTSHDNRKLVCLPHHADLPCSGRVWSTGDRQSVKTTQLAHSRWWAAKEPRCSRSPPTTVWAAFRLGWKPWIWDHDVPSKGIPGSAAVKIPPAHAEDARDTRSIPGVGNSNPLQYSCLENSMGRGVWWATVHWVTKSRTWLSTHACPHATNSTLTFPRSSICFLNMTSRLATLRKMLVMA